MRRETKKELWGQCLTVLCLVTPIHERPRKTERQAGQEIEDSPHHGGKSYDIWNVTGSLGKSGQWKGFLKKYFIVFLFLYLFVQYFFHPSSNKAWFCLAQRADKVRDVFRVVWL